jgi:hypothetical protein
MGEAEPRIFRRDATGRVRYSAERREALLDEFERLGMKGAAFARLAGISYPTFATWIQKRRHSRGDYRMRPPAVAEAEMMRGLPVVPAMQFVEAELAVPGEASVCQDAVMVTGRQEKRSPAPVYGGAQGPARLTVELPGGARMLVGDERQAVLAARILSALAPGRPC